ncbi:hypothetical protein P4268_00300 [Bacillus thuringiensis]|nr:hypothetical protein [Bacillus thuringiensis]
MYYPSLKHLKDDGISFNLIDKLDNWLGALKGHKRKGIRPARFAVDEDVSYELSNEVFCLAAIKLELLTMNYEIYCPNCRLEMVKSVQSIDQIPEKVKCEECGLAFNPYENDEYIEITFDLNSYPDPSSPKNKSVATKTSFYKKFTAISKKKKETTNLNAKNLLSSDLGQEHIKNTLFKPNWDVYDLAYARFIKSLDPTVTNDEKGKALEEISCLLLSFITFFKVDSTVHTVTNQIDVTVTIQPYFKYITIPILTVIQRRILCECKNEEKNVPSIWIDKLSAVIDKVDGCSVGIIFSRQELSGDTFKNAKASQIEHARKGKYIISFSKEDFDNVKKDRTNLLMVLDEKLEALEMRISKRSS